MVAMSRWVASWSVTGLGLLIGCTAKPEIVAKAPPPVTAPVAAPMMPKGASRNMVIPAALSDGSYPTPNRNLSSAATVWHLRAALNVAALACRGPQELVIVAAYNALLSAQQPALAKAQSTYASEWKSGGGDWQDRYDDAMTRLYNFFSQSPSREAFCTSANRVLADSTGVSPEGLPAFAAERLPALEQPFTDFYRAVDEWRGRGVRPSAPQLRTSMAGLPFSSSRPAQSITQSSLQPISQPVPPVQQITLKIDPSVFQ